jgi:hypothetical protein
MFVLYIPHAPRFSGYCAVPVSNSQFILDGFADDTDDSQILRAPSYNSIQHFHRPRIGYDASAFADAIWKSRKTSRARLRVVSFELPRPIECVHIIIYLIPIIWS